MLDPWVKNLPLVSSFVGCEQNIFISSKNFVTYVFEMLSSLISYGRL
jgi:hypothetical protein